MAELKDMFHEGIRTLCGFRPMAELKVFELIIKMKGGCFRPMAELKGRLLYPQRLHLCFRPMAELKA